MTSTSQSKPPRKSSSGHSAIDLLHRDHLEVQQLFHEFEDMHEAASQEEKQELVNRACMALKIHTEIEEKLFYPAVREALSDGLMLDEAEVEHKSAKDLIDQLERMDADDEKFDAVFTVLGEYIEHHVQEEEKEMFPKVRKTDLDLEDLGERMQHMKEELQQDGGKTQARTRKPATRKARDEDNDEKPRATSAAHSRSAASKSQQDDKRGKKPAGSKDR